MAWVISGDKPIYLQLMEQMKLRIISEQYAPGQRIPSVRELASQAAVNPNTMQSLPFTTASSFNTLSICFLASPARTGNILVKDK